MEQILNWISTWFGSHCNGDWEHENQIKISTLDNPGWSVEIDLIGTELNHLDLTGKSVEVNDDDWYDYKIEKGKFLGYSDIGKLEFLLTAFREIVASRKLI